MRVPSRLPRASALAVALLVSRAAAQATDPQPNLYFNMTLSDMSAIMNWGKSTAWKTNFTESPAFEPGMVGQGDSYHYVDGEVDPDDPPSLSFYTLGTDAWVNGEFETEQGTANTSIAPLAWTTEGGLVRDAPAPSNNGVLYSVSQAWDWFFGSLSRVKTFTGRWKVNSVTVTMGMISEAPSFDQVPSSTEYFVVDGKVNPKFTATGNWTVETQLGAGVGGQEPTNYTTLVGDYQAVLKLSPPRYTSFLVLNGSMGPDYGLIILYWTPGPMGFTSNTAIYPNASNPWFYPNAVLYMRAFEPTKEFTVEIRQRDSQTSGVQGKFIGLHSITYYSSLWNGTSSTSGAVAGASTTADSSGDSATATQTSMVASASPTEGGTDKNDSFHNPKKEAIIGGVVGGVAGSAVFILAFLLLKRRANKTHPLDDEDRLTIDSVRHLNPQPYRSSQLPPSPPPPKWTGSRPASRPVLHMDTSEDTVIGTGLPPPPRSSTRSREKGGGLNALELVSPLFPVSQAPWAAHGDSPITPGPWSALSPITPGPWSALSASPQAPWSALSASPAAQAPWAALDGMVGQAHAHTQAPDRLSPPSTPLDDHQAPKAGYPFPVPPIQPSPDRPLPPLPADAPSRPHDSPHSGGQYSGHSPYVPLPSPASSTMAVVPSTPTPVRRVAQEVDGGTLVPEVDEELELVPPIYNPDWAARRELRRSQRQFPRPLPQRPMPHEPDTSAEDVSSGASNSSGVYQSSGVFPASPDSPQST